MPEEDFHPSNQVHFQAHQGPTLVGPIRASRTKGFSPCGAISLSVRFRAAFGSSTCEEDITFAAFNKARTYPRATFSAACKAAPLPALKPMIKGETLSRSAEALLPPHQCGAIKRTGQY